MLQGCATGQGWEHSPPPPSTQVSRLSLICAYGSPTGNGHGCVRTLLSYCVRVAPGRCGASTLAILHAAPVPCMQACGVGMTCCGLVVLLGWHLISVVGTGVMCVAPLTLLKHCGGCWQRPAVQLRLVQSAAAAAAPASASAASMLLSLASMHAPQCFEQGAEPQTLVVSTAQPVPLLYLVLSVHAFMCAMLLQWLPGDPDGSRRRLLTGIHQAGFKAQAGGASAASAVLQHSM